MSRKERRPSGNINLCFHPDCKPERVNATAYWTKPSEPKCYRRFCGICGTPLVRHCPKCGEPITDHGIAVNYLVRFCENCGSDLRP